MRCLIVGMAKTGTTAVLYGVAKAVGCQPAVFVEERIAALHFVPAHSVTKIIFEHETAADIERFGRQFERRILIVRDPRDTLISRLLYMVAGNQALLGNIPYLRSVASELNVKQQDPGAIDVTDLTAMRSPSTFLNKTVKTYREFVDFLRRGRDDWFVLHYEDLVNGNLSSLSDYLGHNVEAGAKVDAAYARVARTLATGDWRNWFTAADVGRLRPVLEPAMTALGYDDDWPLAAQAVIRPDHGAHYFERLVNERRQHYGLTPIRPVLPLAGEAARGIKRITKGDIINRLIERFGARSYLEYNKFDGATYFDEIVCDSKEIAYLPEESYLDAANIQRLLKIAERADPNAILALPDLIKKYQDRKFDLVFFDPVHVRPGVDHALRTLPRLLNPGGILIVHDCNPEREELTSLARRHGSWVGETYKAFALLRHYNRGHAITVAEDFGVGLIWNNELQLDYDLDADIDYTTFAHQRDEYIGLINYQTLLEKTMDGDKATLFAQTPPIRPVLFHAHLPVPASHSVAPVRRVDAQLFWRAGGRDFNEVDSCSKAIATDGVLRHLMFALPGTAWSIDALRFDFADACVAAHITAMDLRDQNGALMWTWDWHSHARQDWRNIKPCMAQHSQRLFLLATSADPQYHPVLPTTVLTRLSAGCTFHVSIAVHEEFVRELLEELAQARGTGGAEPGI